METRSLWFEFATFLFYWGGIAAFAVGLMIVLAPGLVVRAGSAMNRWISTERVFHDLDAPRPTERVFYRHHRLFGCLLALGAAYVIYTFGFRLDATAVAHRLVLFGSRTVTEWLFESLVVLNVLFGVFVFGFGLIVFFRPSALKNVESASNRWIAVDRSLKRLDAEVAAAERMFSRRPRLAGLVIMAASSYVVLSLRVFLGS